MIDDIRNLTSIILANLKNDIIANFVTRVPLLLVLDPESFEPPFTNALDEYLTGKLVSYSSGYNVSTNLANANGFTVFSFHIVTGYLITFLQIVFGALDIIYSLLRLCLSAIFFGIFLSLFVFCFIWLGVTINRRWKLIALIIRNLEFENVC